MPLDFTRLTAAVERDNTVNQSAITLLTNLAQMVRDTAGDPVAVEALAAKLESQQQALADAVEANTPSTEPPA